MDFKKSSQIVNYKKVNVRLWFFLVLEKAFNDKEETFLKNFSNNNHGFKAMKPNDGANFCFVLFCFEKLM
jgi:hypothetical protein